VSVRAAWVLVTAAAMTAILPRAARAVDTIPFTEVKGGLIQVQGSVDGEPAVPMLIDLGAGVDVLSTALGRRLVNVKGKYVSLRLSGERVDLPLGTVVTLALGGVNIEAPNVGVWSGLDGTGIEGLISATAFRNIATTFDFRNHQVIIEDAQTFPERKRTAVKVPLLLQDDLGIALGLFARFDFGNGKTGLCEIDTGSQGIMIDKALAASLGVNLNDRGLQHVSSPTGDQIKARISAISLDGVPETMIAQPNVTFANLIYDCNVGNAFWTNRIFTLDLPNRALWLSTAS
jgi:predicted aspartyl protease